MMEKTGPLSVVYLGEREDLGTIGERWFLVDDVMSDRGDEDAPAVETARHIHTFLIADIRGYTGFTEQHGDEAAAELASSFAGMTRQGIEAQQGQLTELRGDEALAVFGSTRQALRAAADLQARYAAYSAETPDLPLGVGIGLDVGEAAPAEDGYRGGALNRAARLCALAGPGEVLATDTVAHLAGKVEGLTYVDLGVREVKGLPEGVHMIQVLYGEGTATAPLSPEARGRKSPSTSKAPLENLTQEISAYVDESLAHAMRRWREEATAKREARERPVQPAPPSPLERSPLPARPSPVQPEGRRVVSVPVGVIVAAVLIIIVVVVLWAVFH
jgi:adenylate cyclase